jgi:hypothetical protein
MSIANMQIFSGIAFATNYATVFLATIGSPISPFTLPMVVAVLTLAGAIAELFIIDVLGRRVLALSKFIVIFIINVVVGTMGFLEPTGAVPQVIAFPVASPASLTMDWTAMLCSSTELASK